MITTIEDLQKWDENFYTGKVGGPGFLKRQLSRAAANGRRSRTRSGSRWPSIAACRSWSMAAAAVAIARSSRAFRPRTRAWSRYATSSDANTTMLSHQSRTSCSAPKFAVAASTPTLTYGHRDCPGDPREHQPGVRYAQCQRPCRPVLLGGARRDLRAHRERDDPDGPTPSWRGRHADRADPQARTFRGGG